MYALAMMLSRRSLNSKKASALKRRMNVEFNIPAIGRRQRGLKITFSRRLTLKMDLNPNWKYSRSKGRRAIKSSCGGTDGQTDRCVS